jgi:hypothetical protein
MDIVGLVADLPGGESDSVHMAAMLDTTLAGAKHGSAVIHFVSNGTSELGDFSTDFTLHLTDSGSGGIGADTESQMLHLHISGQVVPEPSTLVLLALGLFGLLACIRRRCRSRAAERPRTLGWQLHCHPDCVSAVISQRAAEPRGDIRRESVR